MRAFCVCNPEMEEAGESSIVKPSHAVQCKLCGLSHRTGSKCDKQVSANSWFFLLEKVFYWPQGKVMFHRRQSFCPQSASRLFVHCSSLLQFCCYINPFCGATDTAVLDFWRRLPWISKPVWIPRLRASSPTCNGVPRFTSGTTPADYLVASC